MREYLLKKLYLGHSWSERVNDLDAIYFNYNSCLMKGDTDDNESCRSSFSGDSSFFLHGCTFKKGNYQEPLAFLKFVIPYIRILGEISSR